MAKVTSLQSNPCASADEAKASLSGALTDMGRMQKIRIVGTDIREVDGLYIALTHIEVPDDPDVKAEDDTEGRGDSDSGGSRQAGVGPPETPYIILYGGTFAESDSPFTDGDVPEPMEEELAAPNFEVNEEIYTVGMLHTDIDGRPVESDAATLSGALEANGAQLGQSEPNETTPLEEELAVPNFAINEEIYSRGMLPTDIDGRPVESGAAALSGVPEADGVQPGQGEPNEPAPEEPALQP